MNIAIVGSRDFCDKYAVIHYLRQFKNRKYTTIISGGARGVDTIAEETAIKFGIPVKVFKADWDKYGKSAGMRRNADIVNACDILVAFWDGKSRGTRNSIDRALDAGKQIKVIVKDCK